MCTIPSTRACDSHDATSQASTLKGFCITFVNTEFNHRRLVRSKGEDWAKGFDDFWFETISDGLPPSNPDATQNPTMLCYHVPKHCLAPFRHLLAKLNSSPEVPPVTCIISDGIMSFALKAAEELGIPEVQFWTASACGFMAYLHHAELIQKGIFPFKGSVSFLFLLSFKLICKTLPSVTALAFIF